MSTYYIVRGRDPHKHDTWENDWYVCPNCGYDSIDFAFRYCPACGEGLSILDEEEVIEGSDTDAV